MSVGNSLVVLLLIVLSGFADSLGFVYAARIWGNDAVSWMDVGKSALGWGVGVTLYVFSLRFLARHVVVLDMLGLARQIGAIPKAGSVAERVSVWFQHIAARRARRQRL